MAEEAAVPRWLVLQAEIDFLYFLLDQLRERIPKTALDREIDRATGAEAFRVGEARRIARRMRELKREWSRETSMPADTAMEDEILALPLPGRKT
jgi:hypothetical protein